MDRGRKAVGSPAHAESVRVVQRLRELVPKVGPAAAARQVGCSKGYASNVDKGVNGKTIDALTIEGLGLRRSSKLCRRCGNPAIIVTSSHICVICDLLELGKRGIISIVGEESEIE